MNTYRKNKVKDSILKELTPEYKLFRKESKTDEEWSVFCALVKEMNKDGYVRGIINHLNPDFEIYIDSKGILFRNEGGYIHSYYMKLLRLVISITIPIIGVIVAILALFKS